MSETPKLSGSRRALVGGFLMVVVLLVALAVAHSGKAAATGSVSPSPSPTVSAPSSLPTSSPTVTPSPASTPTATPTPKPKPPAKPKLRTIADVQHRLVALHYLPSSAVSGKDDYRTQQAVMAFQAWNGLQRDGIAGPKTKARLLKASAPKPRRERVAGRFVEVFRNLGVMLLVDRGKLVRAAHVSTGMPGLATPVGRFAVYMKSPDWWSTKYDVWMRYASFFVGGDAIHGLYPVPAYPASHGCVRMSMPEAPFVYGFLRLGTPVFVF